MTELLAELRGSLAGEVIRPEDGEYDAARRCFNPFVDRRPAVIDLSRMRSIEFDTLPSRYFGEA